jgi:hypothetical protein
VVGVLLVKNIDPSGAVYGDYVPLIQALQLILSAQQRSQFAIGERLRAKDSGISRAGIPVIGHENIVTPFCDSDTFMRDFAQDIAGNLCLRNASQLQHDLTLSSFGRGFLAIQDHKTSSILLSFFLMSCKR